jgi:hypothetical protein
MSELKTSINKAIDNLFTYSEKILTYKSVSLNPNPIVVKMKKFQKVVDLMEPDEKVDLFRDALFNKSNKADVLRHPSDDNFLAKSKITVGIGKSGDRILMLSSIYAKTLKLKDDAEKMLEGLPESAKDKAMEDAEELNFPDIITLYVYRILKLGAETEEDKKKLEKIVSDIESELGIKPTDAPTANNGLNVNTALAAAGINPGNMGNMGNMAGGLNGLMSGLGPMIQNLQKQFSGADGKQPDFGAVMQGLVNSSPGIKNVVDSAFPNFGECKSPQDALGLVADKLGNPELKDMVTGFGQKLPDLINMLSPTQQPTAEQTATLTGANSVVKAEAQD